MYDDIHNFVTAVVKKNIDHMMIFYKKFPNSFKNNLKLIFMLYV